MPAPRDGSGPAGAGPAGGLAGTSRHPGQPRARGVLPPQPLPLLVQAGRRSRRDRGVAQQQDDALSGSPGSRSRSTRGRRRPAGSTPKRTRHPPRPATPARWHPGPPGRRRRERCWPRRAARRQPRAGAGRREPAGRGTSPPSPRRHPRGMPHVAAAQRRQQVGAGATGEPGGPPPCRGPVQGSADGDGVARRGPREPLAHRVQQDRGRGRHAAARVA